MIPNSHNGVSEARKYPESPKFRFTGLTVLIREIGKRERLAGIRQVAREELHVPISRRAADAGEDMRSAYRSAVKP